MPSVRRLFVALPLPQTALKALVKYRDETGRETPYLRWTSVANLHITVLFLGDVAEENIPRAEEAIMNVCAATKSFSLVCRGACYAPRRRAPTMVWLLFEESPAFFTLAKRLAAELTHLAPAMDWNELKARTPHVTLARFQGSAAPERLRRLRRTFLEGVEVPVSSCYLIESALTPSGPIYRVIGEYPFC